MAVSVAGQLYLWGLSQALRRQQGGLRAQSMPAALEWLDGRQVVAVACSTDHAGAYTADGQLLLWGKAAHMPPSMLQKQQQQEQEQQQAEERDAGSTAAADASAAVQQQQQQQQQQQPASPFAQQAAARFPSSRPTSPQRLPSAHRTLAAAALNRATSRPISREPAPAEPTSGFRAAPALQLASRHFSPDFEPVQHVSCGRGHTLLLCQPTLHVPTAPELRAAALAVLQAYIKWWGPAQNVALHVAWPVPPVQRPRVSWLAAERPLDGVWPHGGWHA
jgi:hypothetical protein